MSVNKTKKNIDELRLRAHDYRVESGYENGVVFFYAGEIAGWSCDARFAEADCVKAWVEDVIAIETDGKAWVARGGNYQDGATHWDALNA